MLFLVLGFGSKAQNWTPLDTGVHNGFPYGLLADNLHGNLFAFGCEYPSSFISTQGGYTVWHNHKWEQWYPNMYTGNNGVEFTMFNNKILHFKYYLENNDNSKKRTAILQFTNSIDLDTLKILQNQNWLPYNTCTYNGKLILFCSNSIVPSGLNSLATFDGDTIISIGNPLIAHAGFSSACVYKGELYVAGYIDYDNSIRGVMKLTSTGWQTIYEIQGSLSYINDMIVYNNRLYIYGGIFLAESSSNLGNSIIAYDGQKFDTLSGGILNTFNLTNGNIYDASVSDNKLYVCGNFNLAGGCKARGIAYWNDTTWCGIYKDLDSTGVIWRLESLNDTIYAGADFHRIYGNTHYGLVAKLNNMSYADSCSAPRYFREIDYDYQNLQCVPNPFSDNVIIQIPNSYVLSETKLTVTNNLGQKLLSFNPDSYNQVLNLSSLSLSMYFLTVQDNTNKVTVKIIKQ